MIARSVGNALSVLAGNYEKIDFSYNALQAYCTQKADQNPKSNISLFKYTALTIIADIGSLITTSVSLVINAQNKFKVIDHLFIYFSPNYEYVALLILGAVPAAFIATAILGVYLINRSYKPTLTLIEDFSINRPFYEKARQVFFVMRIITNIALAVLNPYNPFFVFNAALEVFTLVKVTQRKWIEYKKEFACAIQTNQGTVADKVRITYNYLIQSIKVKGHAKDEEDKCSICWKEKKEKLKDVYFCPQHTTHSKCLLADLGSKSKGFDKNLNVTNRQERATDHYSRGVYTHTTYNITYFLTVPKASLPSCAVCRDISDHNRFTVNVYDILRRQWARGIITWTV